MRSRLGSDGDIDPRESAEWLEALQAEYETDETVFAIAVGPPMLR